MGTRFLEARSRSLHATFSPNIRPILQCRCQPNPGDDRATMSSTAIGRVAVLAGYSPHLGTISLVKSWLGAFLGVVVVLVLATQACSGPTATVDSQDSPEARATSVRRTAVAEVQRIIANRPPSTAT